jgi:hypothetical protein
MPLDAVFDRSALAHERAFNPVAGVLAGVAAGAAYIVAQALFASFAPEGAAWLPLQRISAILLGPDAVDARDALNIQVAGMALLIHFALAAVYGRFIDAAVRGRAGLQSLVRGALVGLAIYAVNYWLIAPVAFPWFAENRGLTTVLDHLLFGVVAAGMYTTLRQRLN